MVTNLETALAKVDDEIATVRDWSPHRLVADSERCADLLASNGIMFWWPEDALAKQRRRAGKPLTSCDGVESDPDEVFAALPRGLAILALRRDGVEFDDMHICDNKHQGLCERGEVTFRTEPSRGDIKTRGAVFTPRALAEMATNPALEPLVYKPGPLDTANRDEWVPVPAEQILGKKVGDIAVGCGTFPLAALRYLSARILDQWQECLHEQDVRALVATQCLYGVDIDPGSIAICRMVMALMVPLFDLDVQIWRHFRCGDSLLGITNLDQLRWMHLDPARGREIHKTQPIPEAFLADFLAGHKEAA